MFHIPAFFVRDEDLPTFLKWSSGKALNFDMNQVRHVVNAELRNVRGNAEAAPARRKSRAGGNTVKLVAQTGGSAVELMLARLRQNGAATFTIEDVRNLMPQIGRSANSTFYVVRESRNRGLWRAVRGQVNTFELTARGRGGNAETATPDGPAVQAPPVAQ